MSYIILVKIYEQFKNQRKIRSEWKETWINCLLIAGAILMSKNVKISQILFGLCFGIDCINFVFKIINNPGAPMLFFIMSFQFVIMEMTIINQRQQNKKKMEKASCDGGLQS